jgi:hypothetical protein
LFDDSVYEPRLRAVVRRLPELRGDPVRIQTHRGLRDRRGPVHAGSFLRERRIAFNCTRAEFPRILVHELAHFIWLRLGNERRHGFEQVLRAEVVAGARGDLGWSAEYRKQSLTAAEIEARSRAWREYCCEAFCDTAAWLWSGVTRHTEFTLAKRHRLRRARWFRETFRDRPLSI